MTISTTTSKVGYNGNGVTTAFSVPFLFLANADLTVVLLSSAGVETTLTLSTHYTVTGAGNDSGGTLTMVTPPAVGERLTILREVVLTQETDYISGDPFPAETHERALDRLVMIAQQLTEVVSRSLRFPVSDTASPELPAQSIRMNKLLAFDSNGDITVAAPVTDSATDLRLDLADPTGAAHVGADDGASGTVFTTVAGFISDILSSAGSALLGFIQSGTGAVVRTAQSKLRESVTFEDFGAVGDGVTNDTVAVQAALRCGSAVVNGTPGKTYLVNATLYVDNAYATEVRLNKSTIKVSTGVNLLRLQNAAHSVIGGTLDGDAINAQIIGVIVHDTAAGSRILNNTLIDIGGSAVNVQDGADDVLIEGNTITNCGTAAVTVSPYINSIYVNVTEGVQVIGNKITQCNWGIYMRGSAAITPVKDFVVSRNYIIGTNVAASQGISNQYPYNGVISENVVKDFGDNAIDCYGGVYVTISANKSEACKDGVFVGHSGTRQMVVMGNTSVGDERAVRVLDGASDIVVSDNVCRNPVVDGIEVGSIATAKCDRVSLIGNKISCSGSGVNGLVLDNTEMCTVTGNSVHQPDQVGISIANSNLTTVSCNHVQDASAAASNTYDGIVSASTSNRTFIDSNVVYGGARYLASILGGSGSTARFNRYRALGTGGVNNAGTLTVLTDNVSV